MRSAPGSIHEALSSPGRPLDAPTRAAMEPRFGYDFGDIRVHTDPAAARSAESLGARAYTVGNHIVVGARSDGLATAAGRRLLAHELTHTVQQRDAANAAGGDLAIGDPNTAAEREAERSERTAQVSVRERSAGHVQRQLYGPPTPTGAGADFDAFLYQFAYLEQAAIADGYSLTDRITAFRKLYYDSPSAAKTYAGAVVGGGVWNILIPGAAGTALPPSWSTPTYSGSADYLRKHQVLAIAGRTVDIGHMLAGADAAKHPTSISLAAGTVKLRSNVEASTFIGDLGSVVTEYIHGSPASFRDTAMVRTSLLDSYYDGSHAMASAEDMAGNADAYALNFDPSKTMADSLKDYYAATKGGARKRFTTFAAKIGLGPLTPVSFALPIGGTVTANVFPGDTPAWRAALQEEVFNAALAYAAGKGWKTDVFNVLNDPGPGLVAPTFWEMYSNISEWVVDIFVDRLKREVAKE